MRKFYAACNRHGFANSWAVLVFSSKKCRDDYVKEHDGYSHHLQRMVDCRAITKDKVTYWASNDRQPKPFSGECWIIRDADPFCDIPGCVGEVVIGIPERDYGTKLF